MSNHLKELLERFHGWKAESGDLTEEISLDLDKQHFRGLSMLARVFEIDVEELVAFFISESVDRVMKELRTVDWRHWCRVDSATLMDFAALEADVNPATAKVLWTVERAAAASPVAVSFVHDVEILGLGEEERASPLCEPFGEADRRQCFYETLRLGLSATRAGTLISLNDRRDDEAIIRTADYLAWARPKRLGRWNVPKQTQQHEDVLEGWKEIISASGLAIAEKQLRSLLANANFETPGPGRRVRIRRVELERALAEARAS